MKALINLRLFKPFRKIFLERIRKDILHKDNVNFCCHVKSWHSIFICWKDLKEVKENMNSKYLSVGLPYNCDFSWFTNRNSRISFLDECLLKFENNGK